MYGHSGGAGYGEGISGAPNTNSWGCYGIIGELPMLFIGVEGRRRKV